MLRQNLITRFSTFNNYSSCPLRKPNLICTTFPLLHFSTSRKPQSSLHPTVYDFLVHKHHFSPQPAFKIASAVTRFRNPERSDLVLSFLKHTGFSISQLEKMLKAAPRLLSVNLEKTIKPKLKIFHDFGFSTSDIINIISRHPSILNCSANNRLMPSLSTLRNVFGANGFGKLLNVCGSLLTADLDKSFVPNVEILRKCGLSMEQIIQLARFPMTLLCKPEDMKKSVERIDEMGINTSSKMFIHAIRMYPWSLEKSWSLKERTFRELGLSNDNIAAMCRRFPPVFGIPEKTFKHKVKTFREMGFSEYDIAAALRKYPQLFGFSKETLKLSILCFKEMGLSDDDITSRFRRSPQVFCLSRKTWKLKVCTFKEIGFSDGDIGSALKRSPKVFCLSVDKIKRTKEVLLASGKYNLSCIINYPVSLTCSIDKRYKPRLQMLELLEGKNLIQRWPPLRSLCKMTNEKFHEKYVVPFLAEIGDVYMAMSASSG